jgi:hypothetical protein
MNQSYQSTEESEHSSSEIEEDIKSQKSEESEEVKSLETNEAKFSTKNLEKNPKIFIELEIFLFSPTEEYMKEAQTLINEHKETFEKNHIFGMIENAAQHRPFHLRYYYLLLKDINIHIPNSLYQYEFISYLYLQGICPKNKIRLFQNLTKTIEEYENVFKKDSIFSFVSHDDLESVVFLSSSLDLQTHEANLFYPNINLLDLSIFCGSTKCFKYFFINSFQFTNVSAQWSIRGVNEEIIQYLEHQG